MLGLLAARGNEYHRGPFRKVRQGTTKAARSARSSTGQSTGLLSRGLWVRVPPGAPVATRPKCYPMVAVAQLVESRIVIPVVVGSSPISHPTTSLAFGGGVARH